jgi:succinate dehydrogenase / fumarate reductase cytochrome b subunit
MESKLCRYLKTSIVKKQKIAATGLLLCGFLVTHLIGNMLIFVGPEAFNTYAYRLTSTPLIYVAEVILALIFLTHLGMAIKVTIENKQARPQPYAMRKWTGEGATIASSSMPYTGLVILCFIVWHIWGLKYGAHYSTSYNGIEMRDLYRLLLEYFSVPYNVIGYIIGMLAIGLHLSHGFWSAFQSFGFNHPKYNCTLRYASIAFGIFIACGFATLPIYCYLQGGRV